MNEEYTRSPHTRPSPDTPLHAAALLIDFDNVTMGVRSNMGQELRNFLDSDIIRGKVAVQRAYADWRRYPQYIVPLSEASIDLIFAPAYGSSKKNATDIRLAIDALELVFTRPEIGTFILLSGDSDFSSLVLKLKEYGKYVIGVGLQESTSDILVQNCDEYYSYNRLSGLTSAEDLQTEKHDPWELAGKAIARMAERGDVMRSDRLKQVMLEMDPSFDEKTAGFSKFNRFLGEAAQRELLRLRKRENGQYEVAPMTGAASVSDAPAPSAGSDRGSARRGGGGGRRGGRGRGGRGRGGRSEPAEERTPSTSVPSGGDALEQAHHALVQVVDGLYKGNSPVRDSMAKRKLLERDASFDEGTLGFSKFSLFLKQAAEAGVIEMEQRDDRNYYLTPAKSSAKDPKGGRGSAPKPEAAPDDDDGRSALSTAAAAARRTFGRLLGGTDATSKPERQQTQPPPRESKPRRTPPRESEPKQPRAEAKTEERPPQQRPPRQRSRQGGGKPSGSGGAESSRSEQRSSGSSSRSRSGQGRSSGPSDTAASSDSARGGDEPRAEKAKSGVRDSRRDERSSRSQDRDRDRQKKERANRPPKPEASAPAAPEPAAPEPAAPEPESKPQRTLGRYRSGSRGRGPAAKPAGGASTISRIGPIPDDERPATKTPARSAPEPSESKPIDPPRVETAAANGGDAESATHGPVDHMVRNYAGVGKRTAEVLFDHFGEGVFGVIDDDPGRLTEVLSEGRAKVVVEARRAERED